MADKWQITSDFNGYVTKRDQTKMNGSYLVSGSQNVVSTDGDTIAARRGYSIIGSANSALNAIESTYDWQTHRGVEVNLRSYDDELEFLWKSGDGGDDDWHRIEDGWSDVDFNFTTVWSDTESQDMLLFVVGDANMYEWSGGFTTFASAAAGPNTITKEGTTSWAEEGFLTAGTTQLNIEGTTYTYTGGEGTTTLTGVTPDPTVAAHTVGALVTQQVRTNSNKPASGVVNDIISTMDNQVYVGSLTDRQIFISANDDYTDYTFSAPRLPGEGALITLDSAPTAFIVDNSSGDQFMYISGGTDEWYQLKLVLSADLTNEETSVLPLKSGPQQAAISQSAVGYIKNYVVYISNEPTLDFLGRIQDVDTPQSKPISDPIKPDFDAYDFSDAHVKYFKNNLYVAVPEENLVLVYNLEKGFWEAPWTLPASRFSIIDDSLYFHSNVVPESYRLFEDSTGVNTFNDNTFPINAIARFGYQNFGARANKKDFTGMYVEGYIEENTDVTMTIRYDYTGATGISEYSIEGDNSDIIYANTDDGSLGKQSLGKNPIGGQDAVEGFNKFRVIKDTVKAQFFECQTEFASNEVDQIWEVLAYGPDVTISSNNPHDIRQ